MTYALAFDLDTDVLKQTYPVPSWQNAYGDIRKTLSTLGFQWQQGSVYFGDEKVNAVTCVVAAQKLSNTYIWFKPAVRDFWMLCIEAMNDLSDAI